MKPFEVGIIIAATLIIIYALWQNASSCSPSNVVINQGPLACGGNLNTGPKT